MNYWRLTPLFHELFSRSRFPTVPIGDVVALVQYGCSSLAAGEPVGVPMLRMNNLQNDGWDMSQLKYIEMDDDVLDRYRLEPGDLLFNRTNSKELVGKCEVFGEFGDWVFASYLIRVRLDCEKALPRFTCDFLGTQAGRMQIDRLSRQIIGMTNINAEELKEILLPLPPDKQIQARFVAAMDAARVARRAKLAQADALLTGLDGFLLETLGLTPPRTDDRKVFATSMIAGREELHLNADYFHPERILALRAMDAASQRVPCAKLSAVVDFIRDQVKTPGANYLGLAHVQGNTGELMNADEEAAGACSKYQSGEVIRVVPQPAGSGAGSRGEPVGAHNPRHPHMRGPDHAPESHPVPARHCR